MIPNLWKVRERNADGSEMKIPGSEDGITSWEEEESKGPLQVTGLRSADKN